MFYKPTKGTATKPLRDATLRDFDGGWNVVDSDLNLSSKYAKTFDNVFRGPDGTVTVRPGTKKFVILTSDIVGMEYFAERLIIVCEDGTMHSVDGAGNATEIWNDTIAIATGAPIGWGPCNFANFVPSRGTLVVLNGLDKPVVITASLVASYLVDAVTLNNAFVPAAAFGVQVDRYLCLGGDPDDPATIYIGAINTTGTFAPLSDGVNIDLRSRISRGSTEMTGLASFRGKLIIQFEQAVLIATLGIYASSTHEPTFSEPIENYGAIGHRTIVTLGDELLFCDADGIPALERALFTGAINPARRSFLIDPALQTALDKLSTTALRERCFAIYDKRNSQYMLFLPDSPTVSGTTETRVYVFTSIKELKVTAWARWRGWRMSCGAVSYLGNVFLARDNVVYSMNERYGRDFIGVEELWSDGTKNSDGTGLTPVSDADQSGISISYDWELPWTDFGQRALTKHLQYLQVETQGAGTFNVDLYINKVYARATTGEAFSDGTYFTDGWGWETENVERDPALTVAWVGADYPGYGLALYGSSQYGGGRPSGDERLFAMPAKFKIAKLRFHGDTVAPLSFVSITPLYHKGSIRP